MNIGSVVLIGHSLGGLVALRVASLFPGIISKVAIIASPLPDIEKRRLVKSVIPRLSDIKNINQLSRYYGSHKNLIDNLARFLDYGQNGEKKMDEEEWNKLVYCIIDIVSHPWIKDIEKIICPTLVVYGEKDLALLYFGGTDLYPEFKNAIVLKIDGDHRLPRNKPSELALIIKGFVYEEGDLG
jgi:pimeloyl-ACP methyl ester carboxylesterase